MPTPASGAISLSDVNIEKGVASNTTIDMGGSVFRTITGIASGAVSLANAYNKNWWTLNSGSYAYQTATVDGRWVTSYTKAFAAVRPKTLQAGGRIEQLDWDGDVSYSIDIYYNSSGWVNVASGWNGLAAWTSWNWSTTIALTREELATQWRINVSARANGGDQTVYFSEWYTT